MQVLGTLWLIHRPDSELHSVQKTAGRMGSMVHSGAWSQGWEKHMAKLWQPPKCVLPFLSLGLEYRCQCPVLMAEPCQPGPPIT